MIVNAAMDDRLVLALCAAHSFGFAAFHLLFWRLFRWPAELQRAGPATGAIVQILNLRLIYVFLGIGALCLAFPEELSETAMGRVILAGMSLFWIGRTVEQFIFLRYNRMSLHVLTVLFVVGAVLFALPALD